MESNIGDVKKIVKPQQGGGGGGGGKPMPSNVEPWGQPEGQEGEPLSVGGDTQDEHLEGGDKKPSVLQTPDGSDEFQPNDGSGKSEQEKIAEIKDKITKALQESEKSRGQGGGAPRWFDRKIFQSKTNWKKILRDYITNNSKQAYDWGRPNKRAMAAGYYAPKSVKVKSDLEAVIAIDTSGSMTGPVLTQFVSEILAIMKSVKNAKLTILFWHTEVYKQVDIDTSKQSVQSALDIIAGAGPQSGGTNLSSINSYCKKNNLKTDKMNLLILTDGHVEESPTLPRTQKRPIFLINSDDGTDQIVKKYGTVYFVDIEHK
jgi:predicted metal-dependent peptidase